LKTISRLSFQRQREEKEATKTLRRQTENTPNIHTRPTGGSQEEKVEQGSQQAVYWGQRKQQSFSSSPPAALLEAGKPTPGTTQRTTLPARWHVPRVQTHHHKPRPSIRSPLCTEHPFASLLRGLRNQRLSNMLLFYFIFSPLKTLPFGTFHIFHLLHPPNSLQKQEPLAMASH